MENRTSLRNVCTAPTALFLFIKTMLQVIKSNQTTKKSREWIAPSPWHEIFSSAKMGRSCVGGHGELRPVFGLNSSERLAPAPIIFLFIQDCCKELTINTHTKKRGKVSLNL